MRFLPLAFAILLANCQAEDPTADRKKLKIVHAGLAALQDQPGKKGKKIKDLEAGEQVLDLGQTSNFISNFGKGDTIYRLPWLRVETSSGERGWVFAAAVEPLAGDVLDWQKGKTADAFLGHPLVLRCAGWANAMLNAQTDADFAENFLEGRQLRDTVAQILKHRAEPGEAALAENWFLVEDILPGYLMQTVGRSATEPFLFADFHFFEKLAAATDGTADDEFVQICQQIFPTDSIESFFPIWVFQLDEVSSASLLGSGRHLDFFQKTSRAAAGSPFWEIYGQLTSLAVEDILRKDGWFWLSRAVAAGELRQILTEKNLTSLADSDRAALQLRLESFENSRTEGLRFDLRAVGLE